MPGISDKTSASLLPKNWNHLNIMCLFIQCLV